MHNTILSFFPKLWLCITFEKLRWFLAKSQNYTGWCIWRETVTNWYDTIVFKIIYFTCFEVVTEEQFRGAKMIFFLLFIAVPTIFSIFWKTTYIFFPIIRSISIYKIKLWTICLLIDKFLRYWLAEWWIDIL